jgi:hypothetical protein
MHMGAKTAPPRKNMYLFCVIRNNHLWLAKFHIFLVLVIQSANVF